MRIEVTEENDQIDWLMFIIFMNVVFDVVVVINLFILQITSNYGINTSMKRRMYDNIVMI